MKGTKGKTIAPSSFSFGPSLTILDVLATIPFLPSILHPISSYPYLDIQSKPIPGQTSRHVLPRPPDPATNEPGARAGFDAVDPDLFQRTETQESGFTTIKNALVSLDKVIRELFLERCQIRAQIVQQRAVLDDQLDLLEETDLRIDNLQLIWDSMATKLGLRRNN
ncbi:uncharacterized protein N7500_001559 [Penicillium coprophilum]|uniref:uncharacterized protein n=1 Tax=Penicillium coprophilum TaxID=36646 RepID=UPI0023A43EB9|nr:uncharacterized protein N7500_001559 [Penicillium coprophilum]KAJ5173628.1 hypothetical protein N7500_001559 [Penicillium coprophilum]